MLVGRRGESRVFAIETASPVELDELALRLLDAASIVELLK
jgi:hypothetical protein